MSIKNIIKNNFKIIFVMSSLVIVNTLLTFVIPISISQLLNKSNIKNYNIYFICGIFLLLGLVILSLKYLINVIQKKYSIYFRTKLNIDLYKMLFKVKYTVLNEKGIVYFLEKINAAIDNINSFVTMMLPEFISTILVMLFSLIIVAYHSIYIALFLIFLIFLQYYVFKYINKKLSLKSINLQNVCASCFSYIVSVVEHIDYLKSYGKFNRFENLLKEKVKSIHRVNEDVNTYASNMSNIFSIFINFSQYFLYLYFGYATIKNDVTITNYIFLSIIINLFFNSLSNVSKISLKYSDSIASWDFINSEIICNMENSDGEELNLINEISFKNTKLSYKNLILASNVNLQAQKGDIIFIKGETGSGKSTLLKSLLSFNEQNGIYINGTSIHNFSVESIRDKICYISQNFSLINDSIVNNVLFGRTDKDIKINYSFFDKFIKDNEIVGFEVKNKGGNLSGGDKQKIVLARMLSEDYSVLILDEVTSSMDNITEKLVFDEVISTRKENIIFIISHNTDLMRYANKLWEFKNGTVCEKTL